MTPLDFFFNNVEHSSFPMREHSRAFPGLPWLGGPIAADPNPFAQRRGLLRYVSDGARIQCLVSFGKGLAGG